MKKIVTMKTLKNIISLSIIVYLAISIQLYRYLPENIASIHVVLVCLIWALLIFNLFARKSYSFKNYFLSKWNIFSEKSTQNFTSDLPLELIQENLIQILTENNFKLKRQDSHSLFATTKISYCSWGENIYCDIQPNGNQFDVHITSVCLFQHYSWGKNTRNVNKLLNSFEGSLTV